MTRYLWIAITAAFLLQAQARSSADTIPEIIQRTKPAVVEIVAFDEKNSPTKIGTGFFISANGEVVTNCHVIQGASSLGAFDNHGAMFGFESVLACSADPDLAIVKFAAHDVPFLHPRQSGDPVEGDKVIVIGSPKGFEGTVSEGIISALRENGSLLQISAAISPGSSGSPVLDENGELIGIVEGQSEGQNLNFAIAARRVGELAETARRGAQKQETTATERKQRDERAEEQSDRKVREEITEYFKKLYRNKAAGETFLAANATKAGVKTLPSGLQYKIIKEGKGDKPKDTDIVETDYRATTIDGKEFDSSAKHGSTFSLPVSGVIKGWSEALKLMPVRSKWEIFVPAELAYGDEGYGEDIAPGSTLIFYIELLGIKHP